MEESGRKKRFAPLVRCAEHMRPEAISCSSDHERFLRSASTEGLLSLRLVGDDGGGTNESGEGAQDALEVERDSFWRYSRNKVSPGMYS